MKNWWVGFDGSSPFPTTGRFLPLLLLLLHHIRPLLIHHVHMLLGQEEYDDE